ncbi:hypothetical protein LEN26_009628 [Aphanomyces euteiches]|nr:hypothetical protein LEN26_009628 [Aphanomyces euteiches]
MATPPRFAVDFQVHVTQGLFRSTSVWVYRQFVLTGDTLDVFADGKTRRLHSFRVRDCSLVHVLGHYYNLKKKDRPKLLLSCPNVTLFRTFSALLDAAKASPEWQLPATNTWNQLMAVANSILDTELVKPTEGLSISSMTLAKVQEHVGRLKATRDALAECPTAEEIYDKLLDMEAAYVADAAIVNFAHTVAMLHPVAYAKPRPPTQTSWRDKLHRCPHPACQEPLTLAQMHDIHLKDAAVVCPRCGSQLRYGVFQLADILAADPTMGTAPWTCLPRDGELSTFKASMEKKVDAETYDRIVGAVVRRLERTDMDLVRAMVHHLDFVEKICSNIEYWTTPQVIHSAILRYHKFMRLFQVKHPSTTLVPTCDINLVWHTHQTFPQDYRAYCKALCSMVLEHNDAISKRNAVDGFAATCRLWATHFDEAYSSFPVATKDAGGERIRLPSHACRFVGVGEPLAGVPSAMDDPAASKKLIFVAVLGTPVIDSRVLPEKFWQRGQDNQGRRSSTTTPQPSPSKPTLRSPKTESKSTWLQTLWRLIQVALVLLAAATLDYAKWTPALPLPTIDVATPWIASVAAGGFFLMGCFLCGAGRSRGSSSKSYSVAIPRVSISSSTGRRSSVAASTSSYSSRRSTTSYSTTYDYSGGSSWGGGDSGGDGGDYQVSFPLIDLSYLLSISTPVLASSFASIQEQLDNAIILTLSNPLGSPIATQGDLHLPLNMKLVTSYVERSPTTSQCRGSTPEVTTTCSSCNTSRDAPGMSKSLVHVVGTCRRDVSSGCGNRYDGVDTNRFTMGNAPSSDFLIDFQAATTVKAHYTASNCRFSIKRQTLSIAFDHGTTPPKTLDVRHVHIKPIDGKSYELRYKEDLVVMLPTPSQSRFDAFLHVLDLAKATKESTLPPTTTQTQLMDVAVAISQTFEAKRSIIPSIPISNMTVDKVQAHLAEMQAMYKTLTTCNSNEDLYELLLEFEAAYVADREINNFAHTVHKLHPKQYQRHQQLRQQPLLASSLKTSLREILKPCPSCKQDLPITVMFAVQMQGKTEKCPHCATTFSYESFHVAQLITHCGTQRVHETASNSDSINAFMYDTRMHLASIRSLINDAMMRAAAEGSHLSTDARNRWRSHIDASRIKLDCSHGVIYANLTVDLVHAMVRQLYFILKVCSHADYWSHPQVIAASIARYHQFMHLMRSQPKMMFVPTVDIDLVWHAHQCDPQEYARYCNDLVGKLVDHDDTITGDDLQTSYADTFRAWAQEFDEPYSSFAPTQPPDGSNNAWRLPSQDCRFVGVDEAINLDGRPVFVSVIGTPVFDGRVIATESSQANLVKSMDCAPLSNKLDWTVEPRHLPNSPPMSFPDITQPFKAVQSMITHLLSPSKSTARPPPRPLASSNATPAKNSPSQAISSSSTTQVSDSYVYDDTCSFSVFTSSDGGDEGGDCGGD